MEALLYIAISLSTLIYTIRVNINYTRAIIEAAQLFDPSVEKRKQARPIIKQKYAAARKYGYKGSNLRKVLEILYFHEPETFAANKSQLFENKENSRTVFDEEGNAYQTINLLEMPGIREAFKDQIEASKIRSKEIKSGKIKYPEGYVPPKFKYIMYPIKTGNVSVLEQAENCFCCKKPSKVLSSQDLTRKTAKKFKLDDDTVRVCLHCIKDGSYYKLTKESINDKDYIIPSDKKVENANYNHEFENCTLSFNSWQDNYWLTHCNDYCTFIGQAYWKDIERLGKEIENQVALDYKQQRNGLNISLEQVKQHLVEDGPIAGYLFRCSHCKTVRLFIERA